MMLQKLLLEMTPFPRLPKELQIVRRASPTFYESLKAWSAIFLGYSPLHPSFVRLATPLSRACETRKKFTVFVLSSTFALRCGIKQEVKHSITQN